MGTHRLATRSNEVIMKFFAVASALFVAASAEAQLPIASQYLASAGLYNGLGYGYAAPYAAAYAAPVASTAVDAKFAYGAPVTALNAGPLTAGPVAAAPAIAAPVATATYAASPAIAAPVATTTYAAAAPYAAAAQLLLLLQLLPQLALNSRLKMSLETLLMDTRTSTLPSKSLAMPMVE